MSYDYTYDYTPRSRMRQKGPNMLMQLYYGEGCRLSQDSALPHRDAVEHPAKIAADRTSTA
jgi:hypothetical protein